jgi:hypothetical protein
MNKNATLTSENNLDAISTGSSNNANENSIDLASSLDHSVSNSITNLSNAFTSSSTAASNNLKYEKLVQDYVKLRSKLTILKKAYLELSETSTLKDQSFRKCEQEIEGLNFRNQQLTSRVELLQKDLEAANLTIASLAGSPGHGNSFSSGSDSANMFTSAKSSLLHPRNSSNSSSTSTLSNNSQNHGNSLANQVWVNFVLFFR